VRHRTTRRFWSKYDALPNDIRERADKAFKLLLANANHPSLHFKKVGPYWSARVDIEYRAMAYRRDDGFVWIWIGHHKEYERLIKGG
jgi:hypothetical protein